MSGWSRLPRTAHFRRVGTKSPRVSCRIPPARARTKGLSPFGSSTGTPRPMFVASTRTDGRSPGSRIGASSCLPGGTLPPVAHADETSRSQLRGQLRIWPTLVAWPHRIPFSPSHEGPSVRYLTVASTDLSTASRCSAKSRIVLFFGHALLRAMHNGEHHDLAAVLVDLVDDNVGIFDKFVRSGVQSRTSHIGKFGRKQISILSKILVINSSPTRGLSSLSTRGYFSGRRALHHLRRPSSLKATAGFGQRNIIWITLAAPASDLRKLLVCKRDVVPILRFHQFDRVRNVGLPFRRPCQHPIEYFLHLFFCHSASIAGRVRMNTTPDRQGFAL
jgi:hypothetical protein